MPDRNTLQFRDGERYIDYVLAYTDLKDEHDAAKREAFHEALEKEGLELEHEDKKVKYLFVSCNVLEPRRGYRISCCIADERN